MKSSKGSQRHSFSDVHVSQGLRCRTYELIRIIVKTAHDVNKDYIWRADKRAYNLKEL
jgi:hypothetical protein